MNIVDPKARQHFPRYLLQCGLAVGTIFCILLLLGVVFRGSVVASLGATSFIVFAMPRSGPAKLRPLIGGYAIGIVCGVLASWAAQSSALQPLAFGQNTYVLLLASAAVGLAILGMVVLDCEHPPAAGVALGLVTQPWDARTLVSIAGAVLLLALAKRLLQGVLIDLV